MVPLPAYASKPANQSTPISVEKATSVALASGRFIVTFLADWWVAIVWIRSETKRTDRSVEAWTVLMLRSRTIPAKIWDRTAPSATVMTAPSSAKLSSSGGRRRRRNRVTSEISVRRGRGLSLGRVPCRLRDLPDGSRLCGHRAARRTGVAMIGSTLSFPEPAGPGPAAAWFEGRLWLAYTSAANTLALRSVDVRGAGASTEHPTGLPCGGAVAACESGGRLVVLAGEPGEAYRLTSTADGTALAPPAPLPITAGFVGVSGMASYPGGIAVLWAENAGGAAHLLRSDDGGASWSEVDLPFRVQPEPALCWHPALGCLVAAYVERGAQPDSLTVVTLDAADPSTVTRSASAPPARSSLVALCPSAYHNVPGIHVAANEDWSGEAHAVAARTAVTPVTVLGDAEAGPGAFELSLVNDGVHTWVAWRDEATRLNVGAYETVFELPESLRALLGTECDPEQCPADPRLVCAATDEVRWVPQPPRIANAVKGDLILTPGDGTGVIGTMLEQLEPRQYFDHMGIVIHDRELVRHATMAHDRVKRRDPGRYMTGSVFGEKAPTDGFRADVMTYGWPGTITQSVGDAFFTGFNTVDPVTGRPYNAQGDFFALNPGVAALPVPGPGASDDAWHAWSLQQSFADPEYPGDEAYPIHNFPFVPAYRPDTGQDIDALVVKPAPDVEAALPTLRPLLERIADVATTIDGHYRFYAYTRAAISLDPAKAGPPAGDPLWQGKPPGASWCAGTRPVVCSSFVWTAIQLAGAAYPRIELEGEVTEGPEELPAVPPVDGLYRYTVGERAAAGKALHDKLADTVRQEVYESVHELGADFPVDLTKIGLAGLLGALTGSAAAAAALLGISLETVADLVLLLDDMPDDVATQMCNTFAADRADEVNDDHWSAPGDGVAVSPDDIRLFWDVPDRGSGPRLWHGLYGSSEKMMLTWGRQEPRRVHRLDRSAGPAYVRGAVRYRGQPVAGARVRFGCERAMTDRGAHDQIGYAIEVPAGRYGAQAEIYWPASQEMVTGESVVDVRPGDQAGPVDIELQDPPEWRRMVRITGKIDTVRRVLIGSDDWSHSVINQLAPLTWAPDTWGDPPADASQLTWTPVLIGDLAQRYRVRVDVTVTLAQDLSITVVARSALCHDYFSTGGPPDGDQIVTSAAHDPVVIGPGGSVMLTFDHDSGHVPPDRGHVEFTVTNDRAPA